MIPGRSVGILSLITSPRSCLNLNVFNKHTYNDEPTVSQCVCARVDSYQSIFYVITIINVSLHNSSRASQKCNHAVCTTALVQPCRFLSDTLSNKTRRTFKMGSSFWWFWSQLQTCRFFSPQSHTCTRAHLCISCCCWGWLISWEIIPEAHSLCTVCLTNFQGRD